MTPTSIIKAMAELHGWIHDTNGNAMWIHGRPPPYTNRPDYPHNGDACREILRKLPRDIQNQVVNWLLDENTDADSSTSEISLYCLLATPHELCNAILRATGKFVEEEK